MTYEAPRADFNNYRANIFLIGFDYFLFFFTKT